MYKTGLLKRGWCSRSSLWGWHLLGEVLETSKGQHCEWSWPHRCKACGFQFQSHPSEISEGHPRGTICRPMGKTSDLKYVGKKEVIHVVFLTWPLLEVYALVETSHPEGEKSMVPKSNQLQRARLPTVPLVSLLSLRPKSAFSLYSTKSLTTIFPRFPCWIDFR